ncbi:MAG: hypothetical protein WB538_19185 [Candidatus Sulfotelmatobacter sp.]
MPLATLSRAQDLLETNQRLRHWLDAMTAASGLRRVAAPQHISVLLSELSRVGARLRAEPLPIQGTDSELDQELEQYRRNVERIRELLPSIHGQLLAERARLEAQRARVQSAAEWARASRQTL